MIKTLDFKRDSGSSRLDGSLLITSFVSTELVCFGDGVRHSGKVSMLPGAIYYPLFGPVHFNTFLRGKKKTCWGVKNARGNI